MAKVCDLCDKRPGTGHNVSYSKRRTLRRFLPNLLTKRLTNMVTGATERKQLCTKCLRTMKKQMTEEVAVTTE